MRLRSPVAPTEDPFAFLDAVQAVEPVRTPLRHRAWRVGRGLLAVIGALAVLALAAVAGLAWMGLTPRRLFGAQTTCLAGEPDDAGAPKLIRDRRLHDLRLHDRRPLGSRAEARP